MKIEDQFHVDVPVEEAWKLLLDVERIAPCMPGAQLEEVEGDEYRGNVKVKVGPITAQYRGAARIVEADESARRVVIKAEGRDTRGQGNASATVTATLVADGGGTDVSIDTDLNVTGKVAQFGRGVMADVSSKLLGQFVANLERDVLGGAGAGSSVSGSSEPAVDIAPAATVAPPVSEGPRRIDSPEAEPVDLLDTAGGAVAKRAIPALLVALLLVLFVGRRRRRRRIRSHNA